MKDKFEPEVKILKLDDTCIAPSVDENGIIRIRAKKYTILEENVPEYIEMGFKIHVPDGYVLEITSIPELSASYGINVADAPEYIFNSDKDKEVKVLLHWDGNPNAFREIGARFPGCIKIEEGLCIAKAILKKIERPKISIVSENEYNTIKLSGG